MQAARDAAPGREVTVAPGQSPGLVVESADGAVRVEATLERYLRAEGPRLALTLVDMAGGTP